MSAYTPAQLEHAIALAKRPLDPAHIGSLLKTWNGLNKFNVLNAGSLAFLVTSGQLVRFLGIGGTRVVVDKNDDTKSPELRTRQAAERVFVEVCGTFLATFVVAQLALDVFGKAQVLGWSAVSPALKSLQSSLPNPEGKKGFAKLGAQVAQSVLKPRDLSPRALFTEAESLLKHNKISQKEFHGFVKSVMETADSANPFSFGYNAPEQRFSEGWNLKALESTMKKNGSERLLTIEGTHRNHVNGLMGKATEEYFVNVNTANVLTAIIAGVTSAYLSGGPIQHANDLVFRPWFKQYLDKRGAKRQGAPFESDHKTPLLKHPTLYHDITRVVERHAEVHSPPVLPPVAIKPPAKHLYRPINDLGWRGASPR